MTPKHNTVQIVTRVPKQPYVAQNYDIFKNKANRDIRRDFEIYKVGGSCSKDIGRFRNKLAEKTEQRKRVNNNKPLLVLSAYHGVTQMIQDLIDEAVGKKEKADYPLEFVKEIYLGEARKSKQSSSLGWFLSDEFKFVEATLANLKNAKSASHVDSLTDSILGRPEIWTCVIENAHLIDQGFKSGVFYGENGIWTDSQYTDANVVAKSIWTIMRTFSNNQNLDVQIWPGFVGVNRTGAYTTLGRGGSDMTAVTLAIILGMRIALVKDEGAFYSADPKVIGSDVARLITNLHFNEAILAGELGNPIVHLKALMLARELKKDIGIGTFESFRRETRISGEGSVGTTFVTAENKLKLCRYNMNEDSLEVAAVTRELAKRRKSFRQSASAFSDTGSLIIPASQFEDVKRYVPSLKDTMDGKQVGIVSVYSSDLDHAGAMEKFAGALRSRNINIEADFQNPKPWIPGAPKPQTISFCVESESVPMAQKLAHKVFVESNWRD